MPILADSEENIKYLSNKMIVSDDRRTHALKLDWVEVFSNNNGTRRQIPKTSKDCQINNYV